MPLGACASPRSTSCDWQTVPVYTLGRLGSAQSLFEPQPAVHIALVSLRFDWHEASLLCAEAPAARRKSLPLKLLLRTRPAEAGERHKPTPSKLELMKLVTHNVCNGQSLAVPAVWLRWQTEAHCGPSPRPRSSHSREAQSLPVAQLSPMFLLPVAGAVQVFEVVLQIWPFVQSELSTQLTQLPLLHTKPPLHCAEVVQPPPAAHT